MLRCLCLAGVALAGGACGRSQESWQTEVAGLNEQLQQRQWQIENDQRRINELMAEQQRLNQSLADLQVRFDTETAALRASVTQLQTVVAQARQQAAQQAAYPTALLDGSPLPEGETGPREVASPPIALRHIALEWHWRSSHGGEATVSFSASVRRDLSEYCSMCTIWVKAACSDDETTLTDVRAIAEAENIMDMGAGDTAEMSSAIFRNSPVDVQPIRCDVTVSLAESSDHTGGVLLGRYCWSDDGNVRERACR
jgi:hypothetical protein